MPLKDCPLLILILCMFKFVIQNDKICNITKHLVNRFDKTTISGGSLLVGGIQWFLGILAAESWFDGYSNRIDYVSDLGTGPTASIYNLSVFMLGAFLVVGAFFLIKPTKRKLLPVLLTISGIGAMGVGIFPANLQPMHSIATLLAILFGSLQQLVPTRTRVNQCQ
jgi:hypothetical membrane protein